MSVATISYRSLSDASSEARQVANRLTWYANSLDNSIYKKLNNYNGEHTDNINTAKGMINSKVAELRDKSTAYNNYANDLNALKTTCQDTDKTVKTMVSKLTADFKNANGIKDSKVQNTINYFLTSWGNSTSAGRWLNNISDKVDSVKDYIKQSFKDWWNYDGGKELIKGGALALLGIVGGVCAVITGVAALVAGGTIFAMVAAVAGVITGVIAVVNGGVNLINEIRAYDETHNNADPALGSRRSSENTIQDFLRRETDSQFWHNIATGIDIVNIVCGAITFVKGIGDFVKGIGNLIKNAYKWTTGSMAKVENLRVKDILTKDIFSNFIKKIKSSKIVNVIRSKDATIIKKFVLDFKDDFINNLKNSMEGYKDFSNLKNGASSVKKWESIATTLIKEDFSAKSILVDTLLKKIVLPNIELARIVTYEPGKGEKTSIISMTNLIETFTSPFKIYKSGQGLINSTKELSELNTISKIGLFNKFEEICNFSIAIPQIAIPTPKIFISQNIISPKLIIPYKPFIPKIIRPIYF